ncbi:hypothetical protein GE09DRAFT_1162923 [Coniochaeta sp. 2T2.1]|nr:hypothetical protein GE09DRAFT_1162923 [Coniochaeta sp. 2T2.1]
MQLTSLLVAITGATLATAAEIESRIPRLGAFAASQTFGCPLATRDFFEFALGAQSDACRTFYNNTTYQAIDVYYWKPECLLTLFNTYDCTDPVSYHHTRYRKLCGLICVEGHRLWNRMLEPARWDLRLQDHVPVPVSYVLDRSEEKEVVVVSSDCDMVVLLSDGETGESFKARLHQ